MTSSRIHTDLLGMRARIPGKAGHDYAEGSPLHLAAKRGPGEVVVVHLDREDRLQLTLRYADGKLDTFCLSSLEILPNEPEPPARHEPLKVDGVSGFKTPRQMEPPSYLLPVEDVEALFNAWDEWDEVAGTQDVPSIELERTIKRLKYLVEQRDV